MGNSFVQGHVNRKTDPSQACARARRAEQLVTIAAICTGNSARVNGYMSKHTVTEIRIEVRLVATIS